MITKRTRGSTQEQLRQFAINSSKGVDGTKAPTEPNTVYRMKNLVLNPDGSVGPRKPLKFLNNVSVKGAGLATWGVWPLYDGEHYLTLTADLNTAYLCIRDGNGDAQDFKIRATDYTGVERTVERSVEEKDAFLATTLSSSSKFLPHFVTNVDSLSQTLSKDDFQISVTTLQSATIVGNIYVHLNGIFGKDILNPALYDAKPVRGKDAIYVPRYLRIWYGASDTLADNTPVWHMDIHTPEVNTLNSSEGEIPLNPNLLLDNPYALRDNYEASTASVKGVMAYVLSRTDGSVGSSPVLYTDGNTTTPRTQTFNNTYYAAYKHDFIEHVYEDIDDDGFNDITYYRFPEYAKSMPITCTFNDPDLFTATLNLETTVEGPHYKKLGLGPRGDCNVYYTCKLVPKMFTFNSKQNAEYSVTWEVNASAQPVFIDTTYHKVVSKGESVSLDTCADKVFTGKILNNEGDGKDYTIPNPSTKNVTLGTVYPHDTLANVFGFDKFEYNAIRFTVEAKCVVKYTQLSGNEITVSTVSELTESVKNIRYRPVSKLQHRANASTFLKAFCNYPKYQSSVSKNKLYGTWLYSTDGGPWTNLYTATDSLYDTLYDELTGTLTDIGISYITVRELYEGWTADSEDDKPAASDYVTRYYFELANNASQESLLSSRVDVLQLYPSPSIGADGKVFERYHSHRRYMFKIVSVEKLGDNDIEYDKSGSEVQYRVNVEFGRAETALPWADKTEFIYSDIANASLGEKLYYKKTLYGYKNSKFKNNILVSGIDSFITSLYNIIDVDVYTDYVQCIVPWRDYLISATENAMYLHSRQDAGYFTKVVSTSIGIPKEDYRCCKSVLNGLIFKSGSKIYQLYPNVYAGDDSVLNITEMSKPVEDYLVEYECPEGETPFAFSTESEYVLMLPHENSQTVCIRYNYSDKTWVVCEYPIIAKSYSLHTVDDIRIIGVREDGIWCEFQFDAARPTNSLDTGYGDCLDGKTVKPFEFEWDTGQKTAGLSQDKRFVETKLVFATDDVPELPTMSLVIAVDGDPHIFREDVHSDAFTTTQTGVSSKLGTGMRLSNVGDSTAYSDKGIIRQYVARYSGRGRSVRHILSGKAVCNFRIYESYIRYKNIKHK